MENHVTSENQQIAQRYLALQGMGQEAAAVAMRYFADRDSLGTSMKGFQDWLTAADGAVEKLLRAHIAEAFPQDGVLGEEGGYSKGASDGLWIIDPIDGTANFARGDRIWSISIGFVWKGAPELGLIAAPALGETFLARRGKGARLNGAPIRASTTDDMRRSTIEIGWSPRMPVEDYVATLTRVLALGANVKRCASGALGMAHIANGRSDGYIELHINSWDVAAGLVIASEAGAFISAYTTGNWIENGNPVLCCTKALSRPLGKAAGI
jgi:myo-inositol-1(or 4)-monophosphatase